MSLSATKTLVLDLVLPRTKLDKFGGKLSESLLPLLDKMIEPFNGIVDQLFWNAMSIVAPRWGPSGMRKHWVLMSGWINVFSLIYLEVMIMELIPFAFLITRKT